MALQQLTGEDLAEKVAAGVPESVDGMVDGVLRVKSQKIADVANFMKSDSGLDFNFLNSISAVDYIDHFEVVYHLTSLNKRHTAIVKTRLDGRDDLTLPSVYHLWRGSGAGDLGPDGNQFLRTPQHEKNNAVGRL